MLKTCKMIYQQCGIFIDQTVNPKKLPFYYDVIVWIESKWNKLCGIAPPTIAEHRCVKEPFDFASMEI